MAKVKQAANEQTLSEIDPRLERIARLWAEHRGRWIDPLSTQAQLDALAREVLGAHVFDLVVSNARKMSASVWKDRVAEQERKGKR